MKEAYESKCEGLIVKLSNPLGADTALRSFYDTSGKRTGQWVKLKNKGLVGANMRDTLDLIPIGAYYGQGKRRGLFGSFRMASYSPSQQ